MIDAKSVFTNAISGLYFQCCLFDEGAQHCQNLPPVREHDDIFFIFHLEPPILNYVRDVREELMAVGVQINDNIY